MIHLLQFVFFVFTTMLTPGPNNLMLMHSGLNFGYKRSMFHFIGSLVGLGSMLCVIAFGLGYVFEKIPSIQLIIKILGTIYMLYLAWRVSQMREKKNDGNRSKPFTLIQAILFQWVNPKAWVLLITYSGMYHVFSQYIMNAIGLVITVCVVSSPCLLIWLSFGRALERIISTPKHRTRLNCFLSFLLLLSIFLLWV